MMDFLEKKQVFLQKWKVVDADGTHKKTPSEVVISCATQRNTIHHLYSPKCPS